MTKRQRDKAVAWMNGQILLLEAEKERQFQSWDSDGAGETDMLIDALEATAVFLLNLPENDS